MRQGSSNLDKAPAKMLCQALTSSLMNYRPHRSQFQIHLSSETLRIRKLCRPSEEIRSLVFKRLRNPVSLITKCKEIKLKGLSKLIDKEIRQSLLKVLRSSPAQPSLSCSKPSRFRTGAGW